MNFTTINGLLEDMFENEQVFLAVKNYVDWVVVDTLPLLLYAITGLAAIASLGYLVGG